jgi:hypothetical protein
MFSRRAVCIARKGARATSSNEVRESVMKEYGATQQHLMLRPLVAVAAIGMSVVGLRYLFAPPSVTEIPSSARPTK